MARFPSIFRNVRTGPKSFNFKPRYYSELKEDIKYREIRIKEELAEERAIQEGNQELLRNNIKDIGNKWLL